MKDGTCELDVIYCKLLNTCFIVDCLKWGDMHLVDFPLCERIELLHFYFAGVPKCP